MGMPFLRELNPIIRFFMRYYPGQRYLTSPNTPLSLPLNECKVALITTAGFYLSEQDSFESNDCSYREIPNSIQTHDLFGGHKSSAFDEQGIENDPNLAFPIDRFKDLENDGKIGSLNHRHFSFMGSITKPKQLIDKTAPEVAQLLKTDCVDVAFLTPV